MTIWTDRITALENQTANLSSPPMMEHTPAFIEYKAAGEESVPHLLMALKGSIAAVPIMMLLEQITGEQPVKKSDFGYTSKMIKAWEAWGKAEGTRIVRAFDEAQHPRDEHGRWTDGGGGSDGA
jgi:hypothetical protein